MNTIVNQQTNILCKLMFILHFLFNFIFNDRTVHHDPWIIGSD